MEHSHQHDHSHSHAIGHGHSHGPASFDHAFAIGTVLNIGIVLAQLVFGYFANSLALMADAAHNLSDVAGLLLAWGATWLSRRSPTAERTYGFRRASILAALGNAALLLVATGGIAVEAIRRFAEPQQLAAGTVIWVATLAMVLNGAVALMFMTGRHDDLNIKGAFLHMLGDAAVSLGVVLAAALTSGRDGSGLTPPSVWGLRCLCSGRVGDLHAPRSTWLSMRYPRPWTASRSKPT
jgi:cobalt-zinc-cadmium efflux system protein